MCTQIKGSRFELYQQTALIKSSVPRGSLRTVTVLREAILAQQVSKAIRNLPLPRSTTSAIIVFNRKGNTAHNASSPAPAMNALLVHADQDVEHLGPEPPLSPPKKQEQVQRHQQNPAVLLILGLSATRGNTAINAQSTGKATMHKPLQSTTSAATAIKPGTTDLPTPEGNTARNAT